MVDVPPDKDYAGRYRLVLTKLFTSMRNADPNAAFLPHAPTLERAAEEGEKAISCERSVCLDKIPKIPRSITQLHKYFPKG